MDLKLKQTILTNGEEKPKVRIKDKEIQMETKPIEAILGR